MTERKRAADKRRAEIVANRAKRNAAKERALIKKYGSLDKAREEMNKSSTLGEAMKARGLSQHTGRSPTRTPKRPNKGLRDFVHGYITAALWSSTDDQGEPLDASYSPDEIAPATRKKDVSGRDLFLQKAHLRH